MSNKDIKNKISVLTLEEKYKDSLEKLTENLEKTPDALELAHKQEDNRLKVLKLVFHTFLFTLLGLIVLIGAYNYFFMDYNKSTVIDITELLKIIIQMYAPLMSFIIGFYFKS